MGRVKAEIGGNRPLKDVNSEHLELRAGSGLAAGNAIDVGVRDGAKNGLGLEKLPKNAGDVPVRYAPDSGGTETGAGAGNSRDVTRRLTDRARGGSHENHGTRH